MHQSKLVFCTTFTLTGWVQAEDPKTLENSSELFFREDWRENPAQVPLTQQHVSNDQLRMARHGPSGDWIKKSHRDEITNDPWYVLSGMCRECRWAISLRKKNAVVDLSKEGRIRRRVEQAGENVLKVILQLDDGSWLVSDRGCGETTDAGRGIAKPNLTRVRAIGWTDLTVGNASKGCTRPDWIEVSGNSAKQ